MDNSDLPKKNGGARTGAGRKPGVFGPEKQARLAALVAMRQKAAEHAESALQVLVDILKTTTEPATSRIAAAKEILDRAHGKSVQPMAGADGEGPIELSVVENIMGTLDGKTRGVQGLSRSQG